MPEGDRSAFPPPGGPGAPADPPRTARQNVLAGQRPVPVPGEPPASGGGDEPPPSAPSGPPKRFSPRNWRVRSRLTVLVLVPLIATVALAANRIATQVGQVRIYDHAQQLARTAVPLGALMDDLQDERDTTVQLMVASRSQGSNPDSLANSTLTQQQQAAIAAVKQDVLALTPLTAKIDSSYPATTQRAVQNAVALTDSLGNVRHEAQNPNASADKIFSEYNGVIDSYVALHSVIAVDASDQTLITDTQVLTKLAALTETISQERGFIVMTLAHTPWDYNNQQTNYATLQGLVSTARTETSDFQDLASPDMRQYFDDQVTGSDTSNAQDIIDRVMQKLSGVQDAAAPPDYALAFNTLDALVDQHKKVREAAVGVLVHRSQALSADARNTMYINIGVIIGIILLATIGTLIIARSLVRPLRVLQNTALEIAGSRLPEMVRRLRDADGSEAIEPVTPIALSTTDEVGQVARAFDEVHREAVRLATEQAMLRNNVNSMFVNLSRRSQSLVQRQLRLIDELESSEQDPDQLSSLFKLDHLATRMRRNGENLLVLAGEEPGRRWSQPVPLLDVLRAAASEVEQYERVVLRDLPVVEAAGRTVNDLVHLVAELLENASSFSAPETKVTVTGNLLNTGGVMLEIEDSGIGMTPEELDDANERLANPPVVDVAISRRMGLFVVGRLATRHGIQVRLRRSATGGITALVLVPATLLAGNLDAGRPGALGTGRIGELSGDTGQQPVVTATGLPRRPGGTRDGRDAQRELPAGAPGGQAGGSFNAFGPAAEAAAAAAAAPAERAPRDAGAGDGWEDMSAAAPPYRGAAPAGLADMLDDNEARRTGQFAAVRDERPPAPPEPERIAPRVPSPPPAPPAPAFEPPAFEPPAFEPPAFEPPVQAGNAGNSGQFQMPSFDTGSFERPPFNLGSEELDGPLAAALDNSATFDFRPGPDAPQAPPAPQAPADPGFRVSAGDGAEMRLNFSIGGPTAGSPVVPPGAVVPPVQPPVPPVQPPLQPVQSAPTFQPPAPPAPPVFDQPPFEPPVAQAPPAPPVFEQPPAPRFDQAPVFDLPPRFEAPPVPEFDIPAPPPPPAMAPLNLSASFDDLLPNIPPVEQTGEFPAYLAGAAAPAAPANPVVPRRRRWRRWRRWCRGCRSRTPTTC